MWPRRDLSPLGRGEARSLPVSFHATTFPLLRHCRACPGNPMVMLRASLNCPIAMPANTSGHDANETRAHSIVAATLRRPGFAQDFPLEDEGMARRKAQTILVPRLLRRCAGASRRATAAIFAHHAGPRFRRQCPASPTTDVSQSDVGGLRSEKVDQTVVSQLLAGPRSGHGRSPGAARVSGCEPDPQAPHPVPPHDAS